MSEVMIAGALALSGFAHKVDKPVVAASDKNARRFMVTEKIENYLRRPPRGEFFYPRMNTNLIYDLARPHRLFGRNFPLLFVRIRAHSWITFFFLKLAVANSI